MLLGRLRGGPASTGARDALEIATRGGAGCLGRTGEIGELSVGAVGDLVVLAARRRHRPRRRAQRPGRGLAAVRAERGPPHRGRRACDRARQRARERSSRRDADLAPSRRRAVPGRLAVRLGVPTRITRWRLEPCDARRGARRARRRTRTRMCSPAAPTSWSRSTSATGARRVVALRPVASSRRWRHAGDDVVLGAAAPTPSSWQPELAGSLPALGAGRPHGRLAADPQRRHDRRQPRHRRRRPATRCPVLAALDADASSRRPTAGTRSSRSTSSSSARSAPRSAPGELDHRGRRPVRDGPAGVPQGRHPQRDGDRGRRPRARRRSTTRHGARARWARSVRRSCGRARPRRGSSSHRLGRPARPTTTDRARVRPPRRGRAAAHRRPPSHRRYRRHGVGVLAERALRGGARSPTTGRRCGMSERLHAHGQRRRPRGRRRLGRREPAVRAARAARPLRARRTRASRASAARARCSSTASSCARASCSRPRPSDAEITTVEGLAADGALDRRAAGVRRRGRRAVRLLHARPGRRRARPARPRSRADRRSSARGALGQPVPLHRLRPDLRRRRGRGASRRGQRRDRHGDARRPAAGSPTAAVLGDEPDPARRRPEGAGALRVLLRPVGRRHAVGRARCARRTRTPASARLDLGAGVADPRRRGVVTADDVPGSRRYGLDRAGPAGVRLPDVVRYARRADRRGRRRPPRHRAGAALDGDRRRVRGARAARRPRGWRSTRRRSTRRQRVPPPAHRARRRRRRRRRRQVEGTYEIGMQDQAFLGLEVGARHPRPDGGGVELLIATQWLHEDREQIAACLGLPEEKVRLRCSAASAARSAPARTSASRCTCACSRCAPVGPVKMHVRARRVVPRPRAPPSGADLDAPPRRRRRPLVKIEAAVRARRRRLRVDVAARCSINAHHARAGSVPVPNADGRRLGGAHEQPAVRRDARLRRACRRASRTRARWTSSPTRSASIPSRSGCATRWRPAIVLITGQGIESVAPVGRLLRETAALPMPPDPSAADRDRWLACPGGAGRTADVGARAARRRLRGRRSRTSCTPRASTTSRPRGAGSTDGVATLKFATAEVGQGFVTLAAADRPRRCSASTRSCSSRSTRTIGSAGSTSALAADLDVGRRGRRWRAARCASESSRTSAAALRRRPAPARHRRRPTSSTPIGRRGVSVADADRRQARSRRPSSTATGPPRSSTRTARATCHVAFAFAAHRAVVDVDLDLGLVRVVQIATAQDVGRALNPLSVLGQIEGGIAQGLGLAVMEEIVVDRGHIRNASFTDYLLPTALDAPDVRGRRSSRSPIRRHRSARRAWASRPASPRRPRSSRRSVPPPARALTRVPVRPQDIALAARFAE